MDGIFSSCYELLKFFGKVDDYQSSTNLNIVIAHDRTRSRPTYETHSFSLSQQFFCHGFAILHVNDRNMALQLQTSAAKLQSYTD